MGDFIPDEEQANYETFRECLSEPVLRALAAPIEKPKKKRRHRKHDSKSSIKSGNADPTPESTERAHTEPDQTTDAEDLGDFIDYLSSLLFPCLPPSLRTLTPSTYRTTPSLQETYSLPLSSSTTTALLTPIPPSALDSLTSYQLLPASADTTDLTNLLTPIFTAYISASTAPPPIWSATRTSACELCARDWIPLTYHHLIPKSTHDRVRKRAWHPEERLNSVAWLCRGCHSFVHRVAGNEELAREFFSVELLGEREDVRAWVRWVGRVRWGKR